MGDVSIVFLKYLVGRGVLQAIPLAKYKYWDQTMPIFTKGKYPDGKDVSLQGVAPYSVLYATGPDGASCPAAMTSTKGLKAGRVLVLCCASSITDWLGIAPGIEGIAQAVAEEVQRQNQPKDCQARPDRHPG